jgi:transcriptional regulator with XRE-family HTH domain
VSRSHHAGVEKSTFTPLYDRLRARLIEMRKAAGMNQRQLAEKLGRERSFVARVEVGERRVDLVEFYWICRACGQDPEKAARGLMKEFGRSERPFKT